MALLLADVRLQQYVQLLREYLRDSPGLNRLIVGEESSDRFLAFALLDALCDFNGTPPFTSYTVATFPSIRGTHILLRGAAITTLESVALLAGRNYVNVQDGGPRIGISDRGPLILSYLQMFRNIYEQKKKEFKVAENIEQAWGDGVSSEYSLLWIYGAY